MDVSANQVVGSAGLVADLEMDSLDFAEVALELEREFGLAVACDRLARVETVDDLVDLVYGLMMTRPDLSVVVPLPTIETRDWFAWNNVQPSGPGRFHVTGEVCAPNPGVDVALVPTGAPGIEATTLRLELIPTQAPGSWIQARVWVPARYDQAPGYFTHVQVFFRDTLVAEVGALDIP